MIAIVVSLVSSIAALVCGIATYSLNDKHPVSASLLANLAAGFLQLALTFAILERLLENNRRREEAGRISLRCLHELDYAVWVWQGGSRDLNVLELLALLHAVGPDDPLTVPTGDLFSSLGSRAANTIRIQEQVLKVAPPLREALERLRGMANIRDTPKSRPKNDELAACLIDTAKALARGLKLYDEEGLSRAAIAREGGTLRRDPSVASQEWRRFGKIETRAEEEQSR